MLSGLVIRPDKMEELLQFDKEGRLIWSSVVRAAKEMGLTLKFNGRVRGVGPGVARLNEYCRDKKKFMLLELNQIPRHWVTAEKLWVPPYVSSFDPIPGRIRQKPLWKITGFAMFELVQ